MNKFLLCKTIRKTWSWLMAVVLVAAIVVPTGIYVTAGISKVEITKSVGWQESAFTEWKPVAGAAGYHVYVKSVQENESAYIRLDDQLIRQYRDDSGNYYRADAVGLKAGNYEMKVVPVANGKEETASAGISTVLTVINYDRTGFAWVNGDSNGAYQSDGTLKENAVVLYITEETKDTVTMDVVTNSKGTKTNAVGLQNILNLYKKGYESRPLDVRMIGKVTDLSTMDGGDIVVSGSSSSKRVSSGITIEGIGEDATVYGWGIRVKNASNIEIRNLGFMACDSKEGDDVGLQQDNDHVWVHNCDFFYGEAGSDADQVKGDGALDCKKSTYVTFSYNHFFDNGKSNLLGLSEGTTDDLYITYHHNWYDHSDSRHPRVRYFSAHVYNNYYDGVAKYGIGACLGSSVFVESNYFRNSGYSMLISMQGSDVISDWNSLTRDLNRAIFSKENGGMIKEFNNYITEGKPLVTYQENPVEFDAYAAQSKNEKVPSDVKSYAGGNSYNNFDTSSLMYSYQADTPQDAKNKVEQYAGRINGGDFKWSFNNEVDDASYVVNQELKTAIQNYKTKLVSVGGMNGSQEEQNSSQEATTSENTTAESTTKAPETTAPQTTQPQTGTESENKIHNFTEQGVDSPYFSITGNLSASKGSVSYNGLMLTQCLKMESSTKITFQAVQNGKLTLVFQTGSATPNVKVNGSKYTSSDGIISVDVPAGTNTITKADSNNLYYMIFVPEGGTATGPVMTEPVTTKPVPTTTAAPTTTASPTATQPETESGTKGNDTYNTGIITNLSTKKDSEFKNVVYSSPDASESGKGTSDSPMPLKAALKLSETTEGLTILLKSGTYSFGEQITIPYGNNGKQNAYKILKAAEKAKVTFDFSSQPYEDPATNARGLQLEGDYWYISGITVTGAADNGMFIAGSHNVIERCILKGNRDSGLQISRRNSSISNKAEWPAYNYIINCTSFDNMDPATHENADGFAAKLTCGEGNVFDGCISYCNIDDGWDLYAKSATGSIGVVTIKNCISFANGTLTDGTTSKEGDRNGFKLGGSNGAVPTPHVVLNCLSFDNGKDGFTDNGNGGALSISNVTSYNNAATNFNFYRTNAGVFKNLLTISGANTDKFVGTIQKAVYYNGGKYYYIQDPTNVTKGEKIGTVISAPTVDDFLNMSKPDVKADIDTLLRKADGTIVVNEYLLPKTTGRFADMGARFGGKNSTLTVNALVNTDTVEETTTQTATEPTTEPTKESVTEPVTVPGTEVTTESGTVFVSGTGAATEPVIAATIEAKFMAAYNSSENEVVTQPLLVANSQESIKTGDENQKLFYIILSGIGLSFILAVYVYKRESTEK